MKLLQLTSSLAPLTSLFSLSALPVLVAGDDCQPYKWSTLAARNAAPTGETVWIPYEVNLSIRDELIQAGDISCRHTVSTGTFVNYYTCTELAESYGFGLEKLFLLNPLLLPDCSNIQPNTEYCVDGCKFSKALGSLAFVNKSLYASHRAP